MTAILRQLASPLNTSPYLRVNICLLMLFLMTAAISRAGRPDIAQIDLAAFLVGAERRLGDVDLHRAGDRVGDDQRRRGQIIGAHVGIDAAFEVAIAGKHRGRDEIVLVDRLGNLLRQRARIADAGGAAEADQVEAELIEIFLQPRLLVIFLDHLRAGRQRGLDPRLDGESLLHRLLGQAGRPPSSRSGSTCWCTT